MVDHAITLLNEALEELFAVDDGGNSDHYLNLDDDAVAEIRVARRRIQEIVNDLEDIVYDI